MSNANPARTPREATKLVPPTANLHENDNRFQ
jgi:hypothetical protein